MRPASPSAIKKRITYYAGQIIGPDFISQGQRGVVVGSLDKACGDSHNRYKVLMWLFPSKWENLESVTTKDLNNEEWFALWKWTEAYRDDDGKWVYAPELNTECQWILDEIHKELSHANREH